MKDFKNRKEHTNYKFWHEDNNIIKEYWEEGETYGDCIATLNIEEYCLSLQIESEYKKDYKNNSQFIGNVLYSDIIGGTIGHPYDIKSYVEDRAEETYANFTSWDEVEEHMYNVLYKFLKRHKKEKENIEMKNEYKTIINITEANINGDFTAEPYEYVIHTEEPPTEENFNDCYFQAIEIEGISSDCYIDIYTTLNGEFFNHDEGAILKPVKIVYTDVPSRFIEWGNQTPHIFTIDREQSKIEIEVQ